MKTPSFLYLIFLTATSAIAGFACTSGQGQEDKMDSAILVDEPEGMPLIYHMSFMSRYTKKLYFSGEAENWELADIYSHEIEEIAEGIAERNEEHDGIDVSELITTMLIPQIEQVEEAIDHQNLEMFRDRYTILIQTCNQCHTASNYGAVRVTVPETNPFNQDFSNSSE